MHRDSFEGWEDIFCNSLQDSAKTIRSIEGGEMMKDIEGILKKHGKIIEFMKSHGGIIDWSDPAIDKEISDLIFDAIPEAMMSYCETETYMLNPGIK